MPDPTRPRPPSLFPSWTNYFTLQIKFYNQSANAPHYPDLVDFTLAIGYIRISMNPAGLLISRDGASLPGLQAYAQRHACAHAVLRQTAAPHHTCTLVHSFVEAPYSPLCHPSQV
jgi:hypothetical protein